jgi:hypothetical protein
LSAKPPIIARILGSTRASCNRHSPPPPVPTPHACVTTNVKFSLANVTPVMVLLPR